MVYMENNKALPISQQVKEGSWMQDAQVYKANALVEASYRLTVYEQRVILACIAQVRRDKPLTDQQLYTVTAQQVADMSGTSLGTAYQNLRSASERLFDRRVTLHEAPNGDGGAKVRLVRWVQEVVYQESMGAVALRFSAPMIPYLSQLTAQFTRYALADVARMTSAHGIRLYELLVQWESVGTREVSVEWLRDALQLEGRYPAIKDLKRWVIEPAVEQVNEHSPLAVSWSQRKSGRRVSHLVFKFGPKAKASATSDASGKPPRTPRKPAAKAGDLIAGIPRAVLEEHARPGETFPQVAARLHQARREGAIGW